MLAGMSDEIAVFVLRGSYVQSLAISLLQRNAVEGCITHDADLAMLEPEARDQFGRRLGGHCRRGQ